MCCKSKCKELSAVFKQSGITTGWITVAAANVVIWGAVVSFFIVYHIPRDTSENNAHNTSAQVGSTENETQLLTTNGSNNTAPRQLSCSDSFYLDDERNVCFPECGEWSVYPKELGVVMNTLVILSFVIGIIGGTTVLLLSCLNYRKTFTFPSTLIRYQTACVMVYDVVLLIGRTAPTKLFCQSKNLIENLEDPTPFCSIMGIINHYTYYLAIVWWLIHIVAIYWGLKYPFHAHKYETSGKMKYLNFAAVVVGFVLPWISIGVVLGTGGYTFASVPPRICIPSSISVSFYDYIMPVIILQAAGTSLLIVILWIVCKLQRRKDVDNENGIQKVKIKIIIVLCYFVGTGIFIFLIIALRFWRNTRPLDDFNVYFTCESLGTSVGNTCDRSAIDGNISSQVLLDIVLVIFGSFPAVNLLYAINIRELREKWEHCHLQCSPS